MFLKIYVCDTPENFEDNAEAVARRCFAKLVVLKMVVLKNF